MPALPRAANGNGGCKVMRPPRPHNEKRNAGQASEQCLPPLSLLTGAEGRKRKGRRWIVSETVSRGRETGQQMAGQRRGLEAAGAVVAARRGRGRWVALGIVVVVLAAGVVAGWRAGVFSAAASPERWGLGARRRRRRPVVRRGYRGGDAGGRDAGVRGLLDGDRAGRRDADIAAAGRAGDPAGAGAVPDRQRQPGGAAVRQRAGLAGPGRGADRRGCVRAQP